MGVGFDSTPRPRLLLAYSDPSYACRCARYFRRAGWEVHTVASSADVLRLANVHQPRVILVDVDLPDLDGWQTCARLMTEGPDRKVILLHDRTASTAADRLSQVRGEGLVSRDAPFERLESMVSSRHVVRRVG